jgi:O-antigen biosynthesis protein
MNLNEFAFEYDLDHLELIVPKDREFKMLVTPLKKFIATNSYEGTTTNLITNLAMNAKLFIDVGAHYGYFSLAVAQANPDCRIVAYEPVPQNYKAFLKNIEINNFHNIKVMNQAVSDKEGYEEFNLSVYSSRGSFTPIDSDELAGHITVQKVTLTDLLNENNNTSTIIKIDTEGHEYQIIAGMEKTLADRDDIQLILELHPNCLAHGNLKPEDVLNKLISLGYDIYFLDDFNRIIYRPSDQGLSSWKKIIGNNSHANLYCIKKNNSLNILVFSHTPDMGGAERSVVELLTELTQKYNSICTVILPWDGPLAGELQKIGAATIIGNGLEWWGSQDKLLNNIEAEKVFTNGIGWLWANKELLTLINPDIVMTNTIAIPWGAFAAQFINKPHIWNIREFGQLDQDIKFILPFTEIKKLISESSNRIFTASDAIRNQLFPHENIDKFLTVSTFINIDKLDKDSTASDYIFPSSIKLAIIGVISEQKGQEDAINAVYELIKRYKRDIELVIMGRGRPEYITQLKEMVQAEQMMDRIRFIEYRDSPFGLMSQADIILVCSKSEALGRVIIEALSIKKPVIATDNGGIKEIITDGINGLLYTPGDYISLIEKINGLIDHPEKRKYLADNGYQTIKDKFTIENYGGKAYKAFIEVKDEKSQVSRLLNRIMFDSIDNYYTITNNELLVQNKLLVDKMNNYESTINIETEHKLHDCEIELNKLKNELHNQNILKGKTDNTLHWALSTTDRTISSQKIIIHELEQNIRTNENKLQEVYNTNAWHFIQILWRIRMALLPYDSYGEHIRKTIVNYLYQIFHKPVQQNVVQGIVTNNINQLDDSNYQKWITENEPSTDELIEQIFQSINIKSKTLISIVMPVYFPPIQILKESIESVLNQTYPFWELCIVNGCPESPQITKTLNYYSELDSRIRVKHLDCNYGITGNTNMALNMVTGEFVGFLDHDDLLAPYSLFEVSKIITSNNNVDLIYSDEDKVTVDGIRYDAFFKPTFSPDYLRTNNYLAHFILVRHKLGMEIGWIQPGFEGAQDYDFVLRIAEKSRIIAHIPKILYHWRAILGSTAANSSEKSYASESGIKAIMEHLTRVGIPGSVTIGPGPTIYKVTYEIKEQPMISIIIPNKDQHNILQKCITSILDKTTYKNYEINIIENNSEENSTFELYKELNNSENINIINFQQTFNYSTINNFAAEQCKGDILVFLNNDTEIITPDWLQRMLEYAQRRDVGAVGAKLYYPDDTIQHAGVIIGMGGIAGHIYRLTDRNSLGRFAGAVLPRNYSAITGACLMIRRNVFNEIHGFDTNYQLAFGDIDLCMRIRQNNYLIVLTPYAELYHYESKTRGLEDTEEKVKRFTRETDYFRYKWSTILEKGDEYYNPNLALDINDYSITTKKVNTVTRLSNGLLN